MFLAIDIGNTQTAIGIYQNFKLITHWRLSSAVPRTEDECWILMKTFCQTRKGKIRKNHWSDYLLSRPRSYCSLCKDN